METFLTNDIFNICSCLLHIKNYRQKTSLVGCPCWNANWSSICLHHCKDYIKNTTLNLPLILYFSTSGEVECSRFSEASKNRIYRRDCWWIWQWHKFQPKTRWRWLPKCQTQKYNNYCRIEKCSKCQDKKFFIIEVRYSVTTS